MKSRLIAFLIHLVFSAIIALIVIGIVFIIWYPRPLDHAFNISQIFFLLLAVDVTMGPVLTFIVYQPKKKSLSFDLSVIVLLQVVALGYGLQTIFQGRPAFIVFVQDRFEAVRTLDLNPESHQQALKEGNLQAKASWFKPQWVATTQSNNIERANEILFSSAQGGADWAQLPELYIPLTDKKERILEKSKSLQVLNERDDDIKNQLLKYNDKVIRWLPIHGPTKNMVVLIDAKSAEVIQVVDINPYPESF